LLLVLGQLIRPVERDARADVEVPRWTMRDFTRSQRD